MPYRADLLRVHRSGRHKGLRSRRRYLLRRFLLHVNRDLLQQYGVLYREPGLYKRSLRSVKVLIFH
jgi:hypothetical protein